MRQTSNEEHDCVEYCVKDEKESLYIKHVKD
jgi:hypothetical protein